VRERTDTTDTMFQQEYLIWWYFVTGTTHFYPLTVPDLSEDFHRWEALHIQYLSFHYYAKSTVVRKTEILIKAF